MLRARICRWALDPRPYDWPPRGYGLTSNWSPKRFEAVLLAACLAIVVAPSALAQGTSSMSTARAWPVGVLLDDGRVLVVGGDGLDAGASAELYDPATETFSPTGRLSTAREWSSGASTTATLLRDGRVLIAGGQDEDLAAIADAETYDPATGTFTPTGPMTSPRYGHTATLLADGRVLIRWGRIRHHDPGRGSQFAMTDTAELFDPATREFTATGPMPGPRLGHTATSLADGQVLVIGGRDNKGVVLRSAELYDPTTGTFQATGKLRVARSGQTATVLADGRVLVVGGDDRYTAELYDPAPGTFRRTGKPRAAGTATLLRDGRVLIAGSVDPSLGSLRSAELYDPDTGHFARAGRMVSARAAHAAILLPDGQVLLVGGYDESGYYLASAELFDPATGRFGSNGPVPSLMTAARSWHTATSLPDGRVLMVAGDDYLCDQGCDSFASAELFDPRTGLFARTGSLHRGRDSHTATLLQDGRVLVAGGYDNDALADAELYDPSSGKFAATGRLRTARRDHGAILLGDGSVLVVGGLNKDDEAVASAERYDPATGTFARAGSMTHEREYPVLTLLADGRVLILGGLEGNGDSDEQRIVDVVELYDPATGTFQGAGELETGRSGYTATLLPDGRVLLAGGTDQTGALRSAQLYDPETGTLTATGSMSAPRYGHTATLLSDGRVPDHGRLCLRVGPDRIRGAVRSGERYLHPHGADDGRPGRRYGDPHGGWPGPHRGRVP